MNASRRVRHAAGLLARLSPWAQPGSRSQADASRGKGTGRVPPPSGSERLARERLVRKRDALHATIHEEPDVDSADYALWLDSVSFQCLLFSDECIAEWERRTGRKWERYVD